jgi:hypothetical protein
MVHLHIPWRQHLASKNRMIRPTCSSLFGLSAVTVLLVGAATFTIGLASAGDRSGGNLGHTVVLGLILLGVPTAMLTLLLGGLALIYSRPAQERSRRVRRIAFCLIGALFTPMALWLLLAAGGLSPLTVVATATGLGSLYALVKDFADQRRPPRISA